MALLHPKKKHRKNRIILGICAFNHDSSACLIRKCKDDNPNTEGAKKSLPTDFSSAELLAFAEEERFNGQKHSAAFPQKAIQFCLKKAEIAPEDITDLAFYFNTHQCWYRYFKKNNPFSFLLHPSLFFRKRFWYEWTWLQNFSVQVNSMKRWLGNHSIVVHPISHHHTHIAYGAYTAPFSQGIILSNDSVGEEKSTLAMLMSQNEKEEVKYQKLLEQQDPHSIGYLYGAVTEYLGYKRGNGEGKVMALASFGGDGYVDFFEKHISYKSNGTFRISSKLLLDRSFQPKGQRLHNKFYDFFGKARRQNEPLLQKHYDIAYALQFVTEKLLTHQIHYLSKFHTNFCLTGGVAQNSVANGKLVNQYPDFNFFVPPIPHDAGCSIGAALHFFQSIENKFPRKTETAFLGPKYKDQEVIEFLENNKIHYKTPKDIVDYIVNTLENEKVIAFFRKEMEGGPRALCHRSIIADPGSKDICKYLNEKVKFRESFRPYGGFIAQKDFLQLFDYKGRDELYAPYMSFVFPLKKAWHKKIPSLRHVDGSCRVQVLEQGADSFLDDLLGAYKKKTGIPILINTSFNIKGKPIVRSPEEAVAAFYGSAIDCLIFNDRICIEK